ncbi:hypothetical protein [Macrococcoides caseolyticum]|nr:hypothetical protein [Macrococcus caseolyticus]MCE4956803.1 hypothetical protein [Macrococcus caseolyticus]
MYNGYDRGAGVNDVTEAAVFWKYYRLLVRMLSLPVRSGCILEILPLTR